MTQFTEVVDLTIEDQHISVGEVYHRLMAASSEIDYAEAIVPESKTAIFDDMSSPVVGPAVADDIQHALKIRHAARTRAVEEPPRNATHMLDGSVRTLCSTVSTEFQTRL
jgi:hypothetical protein